MAILRGLTKTSNFVKLFLTGEGLILRLKFERKGLNQMGLGCRGIRFSGLSQYHKF